MPSLESMVLNRVAPLTQKKVAERIGVDATNFSRFLNNSGHRLSFAEFCALFDVLELDDAELFEGLAHAGSQEPQLLEVRDDSHEKAIPELLSHR